MRKYDAVIGGYYGCGNIGDEAILEALVNSLKSSLPDIKLCVLSASPQKTAEQLGVTGVKRSNPIAVICAMASSNAYICGGGSLLQDATSRRSLLYYVSLMLLGRLLCKQTAVFAGGAGPLKSRRVASLALRCADRISARDTDAFLLIQALAGPSSAVKLSADPSLMLRPEEEEKASEILARCGIGDKPFFAVSLRPIKGNVNFEAITDFCAGIDDAVPLFVSMQNTADLRLCEEAAVLCGGEVICPSSYRLLLAILKKADFALGMRLHFLIAAAMAGIPVTALSYECKTDGFMAYAGVGQCLSAYDFDADSLRAAVKRSYTAGKDRLCELRALAESDAASLCQFLSDGSECVKNRSADMRKSSG